MSENSGARRRSTPLIYLAIVAVVVLAAIGYLAWSQRGQDAPSGNLRVAVPPFVDTAFTQVGVQKGLFGSLNGRITLVDATWENQYDLLAGGGLDISMSTLDEFVNKSRNLAAAGRPVVYILPAWKFRGLGFYAGKGVRPFSAFSGPEAKADFLAQLRGKKIVLAEGSVYEQALRAFLEGSGVSYDDLQIVNASLDSAMNSLVDPSVAIVAVGSQQRFEAERRGYEEAISPEALGLDVMTGFVVPQSIYETRKADILAFVCGWYKTAKSVTEDSRGAYGVTNAYLVSRGASSLTFEEYSALRAYNIVPTSAADAQSMFITSGGAADWRVIWDRSVRAMAQGGKQAQAPADASGFVAPQIIADAVSTCR